ncbi:Pentatricopeptide repeat-containing protein [Quillaja saponaria]|uniref:Pentatricopeptide repeat-containing protein n=1 Tax=Quillaja saponaria TaxID=32244 RepID=A0AAD7M654_QUISA|nr:Pentatricopeptide repeat-containing protein [Quillaja saponaria]
MNTFSIIKTVKYAISATQLTVLKSHSRSLCISDSSLYLKLLQHCINKKAEKHGRLIHNHLITKGFESNLHLITKLIIFYCKLGDTVAARVLFDDMHERSVVSWTAMISGYSQNGFHKNALLVFLDMHRVDVKANQFTYGSVMRACTSLRCLEVGMQIQGFIQKSRFIQNLFVQSALVDLHSKCGNIVDASYFFEMISNRDVVCWNAMIGGYAIQGFSHYSFQMFHLMVREGVFPDCFTFGSVLRASAESSSLLKVSQIHSFIIKMGFESNNVSMGSLVNAYAKCGSIERAYHFYKAMPTKDMISCTSLIAGYAREGMYSRDVIDIVKEIIRMNKEMDNVMLCSLLNVCANIVSLSLGRQVHALAIKTQPCYDVTMGNALIDMYAKSGEIGDSYHAFNEMDEKNVISWTTLIAGCGMHGLGHQAIALFNKMEQEGLKPNEITFLSLLFACSHSGLTNEGWQCFSSMIRKYKIFPRAEHFSCMIDIFARGGHLEEAYSLIHKMDIKPNASLWGAILGACKTYGNLSLGEVAATNLFKMDPENATNYVVLASIYAASGAWDNAWETRNSVKDRGIKKDAGYSLLQTAKNKIELLPTG